MQLKQSTCIFILTYISFGRSLWDCMQIAWWWRVRTISAFNQASHHLECLMSSWLCPLGWPSCITCNFKTYSFLVFLLSNFSQCLFYSRQMNSSTNSKLVRCVCVCVSTCDDLPNSIHTHTSTQRQKHTRRRARTEESGAVICQQGTLAARRCHGNCLLPRTGFASQGPQIGSKASEVPPLLHPTHLRLSQLNMLSGLSFNFSLFPS